MKLHLLRRELTHRRGGCRPNRAAPPRRIIQTSPFSKKNTFSNILFRVEYESGLSFSKYVLVWPRSKFEISKFYLFYLLKTVRLHLCLRRDWLPFVLPSFSCSCSNLSPKNGWGSDLFVAVSDLFVYMLFKFGFLLSGKLWMNIHDDFVLVFLMFFISLYLIRKEKGNLGG